MSSSDSEGDNADFDESWSVTPCRTRSSLKPTSLGKSPAKSGEVKEADSSEHFAAYIADRLSKIKSEKKRKNIEDEIIDLVRKCTIND